MSRLPFPALDLLTPPNLETVLRNESLGRRPDMLTPFDMLGAFGDPSKESIIFSDPALYSTTGGTGEVDLLSFTIPANRLRAGSIIQYRAMWSATPSNANAKTLRVRIIAGATNNIVRAQSLASLLSYGDLKEMFIRSTTVLVTCATNITVGSTGSPYQTYTIDTTADMTFKLSAQLAVGTDTLSLQGAFVRVIDP